MNLVYSPQASTGSMVELDENEFHHIQVLRMRSGDEVHAFDGKGNLYKGILAAISKKTATVSVGERIRQEPLPTAQLHIAIAPTKNIDRTEWFAEKATEIGIHAISPVICNRSERREIRIDRLEKVVLSAAKQSLHLHLPRVNASGSFKEFVKAVKDDKALKFIAYCEEKTTHLKDSFKTGESIVVLIGPEGDFTEEEVVLAKEAGFTPVSLGESRLRTETAGVMVSAIYNMKNL
jgi:16S rRNA (uracil1498-N3)-methyltransferase